jgi:hypothetical protein
VKWPWRQRAELYEPRRAVSSNVLELQTAKEILAEVFHARPADVEEMIQRRVEERSWGWEEREERQWPATFCLGE